MQNDPVEEWRRLTELYREMGDVEIGELADQINDLTPTAQQILRDEMKSRGITQRSLQPEIQPPHENGAGVYWQQEENTAADSDRREFEEDQSRDYTWKVALCRCESLDEAAARSEMLRRAGIDSWIQRPGARFVVPWLELGVGDIQINIAADQLDQAQTIMTQPIPQEIMDQLKEENAALEYKPPVCPKCGDADPTLESIDPSNNWLCESCGYAWSDPVMDGTGDPKTCA